MNTLIVDHRGSILEHHAGALIVRIPDQKPKSISLNLVTRLVIAGSTQLDSTLLTHLAERGISLVVMPGRGARRSAILYGMSHGDSVRRTNQYQLTQNPDSTLAWAKRFVILKTLGQIRLLRQALILRPDCRYSLISGLDGLYRAVQNMRQAKSLDSLRGLEGAATARYFHAYRSLFSRTLKFNNRNRRPPRDPVNAALSLGYTLLHSDAVKALIIAGLDPMIGFLHEPSYNRESLACDLTEIGRARIDSLVWRLFAEKKLEAQQFSQDGHASRMKKSARAMFFASYERNAAMHRQWFQRYARALAKECPDSIKHRRNTRENKP